MATREDIIQLKAFARQDGAILALVWALAFALMVFAPRTSFGGLLVLATPFVVGWRLRKFRDYALNGVISLRRGAAYSCYTFICASVLFAAMQYVYLRFFDNGRLLTVMRDAMNSVIPIYKSQGVSEQDITDAMTLLSQMTSIDITFMFMMQNICVGALLSFIIAAVCAKKV